MVRELFRSITWDNIKSPWISRFQHFFCLCNSIHRWVEHLSKSETLSSVCLFFGLFGFFCLHLQKRTFWLFYSQKTISVFDESTHVWVRFCVYNNRESVSEKRRQERQPCLLEIMSMSSLQLQIHSEMKVWIKYRESGLFDRILPNICLPQRSHKERVWLDGRRTKQRTPKTAARVQTLVCGRVQATKAVWWNAEMSETIVFPVK